MVELAWIAGAIVLLAAIVAAQRRGPFLQYLYLCRFPLLVAATLVGVVPLALRGVPSLLRNLFSLGGGEILLVSCLATLTGWGVMVGLEVILLNAPERFGVPPLPLPDWFRRRRVPLFALLAWPLIGTVVALSPGALPRSSAVWRLAWAAGGVLLAAACLLGSVALRTMLSAPATGLLLPARPRWIEALPRLRRARPKPPGPPRLRGYGPGHLQATVFFLMTLAVYFAGFFAFLAFGAERGSFPALAYVLLILILALWGLPGVSFFLDRYRVPALLPLLLVSYLASRLVDTDHYYAIGPPRTRPAAVAPRAPQPAEALNAAQAKAPELPAIVVATSGGGITASLWTAVVLTSLQREVGVDFTRSIRLISSVSGGSVGTLYFLDRFAPDGYPPPERLDSIVRDAGRSSLDAAAWGLAYPDLWRVFSGFLVWSKTLDRGWSLERMWRLHLDHPDASLADWRLGVQQGWLPPAVLNATVSETGEQFLLTPLDPPAEWQARFFSREYPGQDVPLVTAARLSATFPWVSPITRARTASGPARPDLHLADGGYYDNFGVVSVVNWLRTLREEQRQQLRRRLLVILIRAFPDSGAAGRGLGPWLSSTLGPVVTMYKVRTSTQAFHNSSELAMTKELLKSSGMELEPIIFQLERQSPLSWKLTDAERQAIIKDGWQEKGNQASLARVKEFFGRPLSSPSPP
ncbi:MAG TPA: hypothetical protein VIA62_25725 [Thermoanaerobaculia bacterium]|jgi:hypothetical protein|nr:hypothetical protein [Thermoanaerobaculia bacterium]